MTFVVRQYLRLVASRDGRDESVTIHQDTELWIARLGAGDAVTHRPDAGRHLYLHVARGEVAVGDRLLRVGDALEVSEEPEIGVEGRSDAEVLLFDLA